LQGDKEIVFRSVFSKTKNGLQPILRDFESVENLEK